MKIDDQMKAKLNLLKENDIRPNFAELARQSGIDYRTIKRYYDGYEGKPETRNKPISTERRQSALTVTLQSM